MSMVHAAWEIGQRLTSTPCTHAHVLCAGRLLPMHQRAAKHLNGRQQLAGQRTAAGLHPCRRRVSR